MTLKQAHAKQILKQIVRRRRVPRTILKKILQIIPGVTTILKKYSKNTQAGSFQLGTNRRGFEMDADHIGARIVKGFGHLYDGPPLTPLPPTVIDILGLGRPIAVHQSV